MLALRRRRRLARRAHGSVVGGAPPRSAAATVQVYVSQLRKVVGFGGIVTRRPGYALEVGEGRVDVVVFGERYTRAREHIESAELSVAAMYWRRRCRCGTARRLPSSCTRVGKRASAAAGGAAVGRAEDLLDAKLGWASLEMVGELEGLVAEYPLRERLRGQLMLALYRSGRQADALGAYQDARRALVEQLGIDPSSTLADLERRILQQDPTLGDCRQIGTTPMPRRADSHQTRWRASCTAIRRSGRALQRARAQGGDGAVLRPGGVHRRVRFQ